MITSLIHTLTTFVGICILTAICYIVFKNRLETDKHRQKLRLRLHYIGAFIFIVALCQIWIEGVKHVLTALGLVGAGLMISNKETIMNFVGFFIINWRSMFNEGDFIQIQNHIGFVNKIHPLHFKLYETTGLDRPQATGKTIIIPNGLVVQAPIVTFTPENSLKLYQVTFTANIKEDSYKVQSIAQKIIDMVINIHYEKHWEFKAFTLKRRNKKLSQLIKLRPNVIIELGFKKDTKFTVYYYAYPRDYYSIDNQYRFQFKLACCEAKIAVDDLL